MQERHRNTRTERYLRIREMTERYNANPKNWSNPADRSHLARYYLARGFIENGEDVLDIGCGHGYGTAMLADKAFKVLGIDKYDVIESAEKDYGIDEFIEFKGVDLDNALTLRKLPEVDVAVALEVIEHLEDPAKTLEILLKRVKRLLVLSVGMNSSLRANPWHKQRFSSKAKVRALIPKGWKEFHSFTQGRHLILIYYKE